MESREPKDGPTDSETLEYASVSIIRKRFFDRPCRPGKWKVQQLDPMGNLVTVYEPNPAGGADLVIRPELLRPILGIQGPGTCTRTPGCVRYSGMTHFATLIWPTPS